MEASALAAFDLVRRPQVEQSCSEENARSQAAAEPAYPKTSDRRQSRSVWFERAGNREQRPEPELLRGPTEGEQRKRISFSGLCRATRPGAGIGRGEEDSWRPSSWEKVRRRRRVD